MAKAAEDKLATEEDKLVGERDCASTRIRRTAAGHQEKETTKVRPLEEETR